MNQAQEKETERKRENQMERLVQKRYEKCVVNRGGRTGQDKLEE